MIPVFDKDRKILGYLDPSMAPRDGAEFFILERSEVTAAYHLDKGPPAIATIRQIPLRWDIAVSQRDRFSPRYRADVLIAYDNAEALWSEPAFIPFAQQHGKEISTHQTRESRDGG